MLAFAGWTGYAYPLILQALNTLNMHPMFVDRSLDFCDMQGHLLRIMNAMLSEVHDLPHGQEEADPPDAEIILSGYSSRTSGWHLWKIRYDKNKKLFLRQKHTTLDRNPIILAGDELQVAKTRILKKLAESGKIKGAGFDMEPFAVLVDMIRDPQYPSIGGPPQVVKTYKHMQSRPYAVFWPNGESCKMAFMGRPMLNYEISSFLILDPDSMTTTPFRVINPDLNIKGHEKSVQTVEADSNS